MSFSTVFIKSYHVHAKEIKFWNNKKRLFYGNCAQMSFIASKKINVWVQWTSDFFDQHNMWIKVVQALSTVWWFEV